MCTIGLQYLSYKPRESTHMNEEHRWECVAPVGSGCGEGALWVEAEQALYWTDVTRFLLHRLSARDGCIKSWFFEEPVVALSRTDRAGCLLVALGSRLLLWPPATDERVDHGARKRGWPQVRFNEGRSGPDGRFWVGSMRNNVNPDGTVRDAGRSDGLLMSVRRDAHSATVHQTGFGIANTLCWTPDQRCLIFGDTLANTLYYPDYPAHWAHHHRNPALLDPGSALPDLWRHAGQYALLRRLSGRLGRPGRRRRSGPAAHLVYRIRARIARWLGDRCARVCLELPVRRRLRGSDCAGWSARSNHRSPDTQPYHLCFRRARLPHPLRHQRPHRHRRRRSTGGRGLCAANRSPRTAELCISVRLSSGAQQPAPWPRPAGHRRPGRRRRYPSGQLLLVWCPLRPRPMTDHVPCIVRADTPQGPCAQLYGRWGAAELGNAAQWQALSGQLRKHPAVPTLGWDLRALQWLDHVRAPLMWKHWQRAWPQP